jgi:RNase P/RNase MRP subunit POP5
VKGIIKEGRRRRYILFRIINEDKIDISKDQLIYEIRKRCKDLYSDKCKKMGIFLVRFDGYEGIIRCKHTEKQNVINLMNSINRIGNESIKVETIGTSGTIKALISKFSDKK